MWETRHLKSCDLCVFLTSYRQNFCAFNVIDAAGPPPCRPNINVHFMISIWDLCNPQTHFALKVPWMNLFLFPCSVLLTSRCLWLHLLCWNGDRLTAGLVAVQKGPHFLCASHSRFSPPTCTLTRLVFPRCFLSCFSPDVVHLSKVSSPSLTSSCVPECVWTGSPTQTQLFVMGLHCTSWSTEQVLVSLKVE